MGSRLYNLRGGKKTRLSRTPDSPRSRANMLRVGVGTNGRRLPTAAERKAWKPKRGRRKLGARRKLTFLETMVRWIKVTTVRKSPSRRR